MRTFEFYWKDSKRRFEAHRDTVRVYREDGKYYRVSGVIEPIGMLAMLARIDALESELRRLQDVVGEEDRKLIETLLVREPQP